MKYPLNIGKDAPVTTSLPKVLQDPVFHLSVIQKPDLAFGRLMPRGTGTAITGAPVLILLRQGRFDFYIEGRRHELIAQGTVARINAGCELAWEADANCEIIVVTDPGLAGDESVSICDLSQALTPSATPPAAVLLTEVPRCTNALLHVGPGLTLGLWRASPYARKGVEMFVDEVMYLLEGKVTLTTPDGRGFYFAAGDILLAPKGAKLAWNNPVPVRKLFLTAND